MQKLFGEANPFFGKQHTEATKRIIGEKSKGRDIKSHGWKISLALKGKPHTKEHTLRASQAQIGRKFSEEAKLKMSLSRQGKPSPMKGRHLSEEVKQKLSVSMKAFYRNGGRNWNDLRVADVTSPRFINWKRKILSAVNQRPNKLETEVFGQLEKQFPGQFKYVGNGSVIINGRSPDFIDEQRKIVVLAHGLYWHLWRLGLKDTKENRQAVELQDSKAFIDAGYEVWFYWEV